MRATKNVFDDRTFIPDAESDELHVEIYHYFVWLHGKVVELEREAETREFERKVVVMVPLAEDVAADVEVEIEDKVEGKHRRGRHGAAGRDGEDGIGFPRHFQCRVGGRGRRGDGGGC